MQKNNQLDLQRNDGSPIINNAFPAVTFADGKQRPLGLDHRRSSRTAIRDPLGEGNGFRFEGDDVDWIIATYPSQPFLTIDLTFVNHTKKPVEISRLSPFGLGAPGSGGVYLGPGPDAIWMLVPPGGTAAVADVVHEAVASPGHLAAWNGQTGNVLVAGFITHQSAPGTITLARAESAPGNVFDRFSADIAFDPPIAVEPGGRLQADTLYLAIMEINPQEALERFALASQRLEPYPTRAALNGCRPTTGAMTPGQWKPNVAMLTADLARYGWNAINLGTFANPADLDALAPVIQTAHAGKLQVSLTVPVSTQSPEQLADLVAQSGAAGADTIELNVDTPPWGNPGSAPAPRQLISLLESRGIVEPAVVYTKPARPGAATLYDWALASRQYYLPPVGNPLLNGWSRAVFQDTSHFTDHQFITAWTLAAVQGALLRPAEPYTSMSPVRRHILSRLLPAPSPGGRPLDLFQEGPPQRWVLPLKTRAGEWTIAALFNWDGSASTTLDTPLAALGLSAENYFSVYDFWAGKFLGLIQGRLQAEVPAEGVRLFGLRRFEKHPMLVASNRHYTQGASDHTALTWSYEDQLLSGTFDAVADTAYTLTVLVPEPYTFNTVQASVPVTDQQLNASTLTFTLKVQQPGPVDWKISCTYVRQ